MRDQAKQETLLCLVAMKIPDSGLFLLFPDAKELKMLMAVYTVQQLLSVHRFHNNH